MEGESFTKQMRKSTRDIHNLSDALINAKLAIALSDNTIWSEGLLIFYEIFKYLEENVPENILPKEFYRTKAFEADLTFYLTDKWKEDYVPRVEVKKYIEHLDSIKMKNPTLLVAYVYHLYMGLLSGGQILQKKRSLVPSLNQSNDSNLGKQLTTFEGFTISELKTKMRNNIDKMAEDFDEKLKEELMKESRTVFELNNKIVRTIKDVNKVTYKRISFVLGLVIISWLFIKTLIYYS